MLLPRTDTLMGSTSSPVSVFLSVLMGRLFTSVLQEEGAQPQGTMPLWVTRRMADASKDSMRRRRGKCRNIIRTDVLLHPPTTGSFLPPEASTDACSFVAEMRDGKAVWQSGRAARPRYVTWMSRAAEIGQFPTLAGVRAWTLERPLRLGNGPSNIEQNEPNAVEGGSLHSRRSR